MHFIFHCGALLPYYYTTPQPESESALFTRYVYTYCTSDSGFSLLSMCVHRNRHTYSLKQGQQAQQGKHKH